MAETTDYDLIVIGGGPAGYAGAIRAGQLGKTLATAIRQRMERAQEGVRRKATKYDGLIADGE